MSTNEPALFWDEFRSGRYYCRYYSIRLGTICYRDNIVRNSGKTKTLIFATVLCTFFTYYYSYGSLRLAEGTYDQRLQHEQIQNNSHQECHQLSGNSTNIESQVKEGFIVWSDNCKIPNISAYHETIKRYVYPKKSIKCSTKPALTQISFNSGVYTVSVITKNIDTYLRGGRKQFVHEVECCYSVITRKASVNSTEESIDDMLLFSSTTCFKTSADLPKTTEFVYVNCYLVKKNSGYRVAKTDIYKDMFVLFIIRDDVKQKMLNRQQLYQHYRSLRRLREYRMKYDRRLAQQEANSSSPETVGYIDVNEPRGSNEDVGWTGRGKDDNTGDDGNFENSNIFSTPSPPLNEKHLTNSRLPPELIHTIVDKSFTTVIDDTKPKMSIMPSVLMIGIDSVSRLNAIRSLPKTMSFLRKYDWLPLEGYTKVAENTFPNLIPILTGLSDKRLRKTCFPSNRGELDKCPFIWQDFRRNGYVTAYVEDEPKIGTFNYKKYGFKKQPTDYYLRPFMLAAEEKLQVIKFDGLKFCLGEKSAADYVLTYCRQFVTAFHDTPYFALFWMNSFSHNDANDVSSMDKEMERFFRSIIGYLNDTVVVFLSDHGMRWGPIRQTFVGWLEERMPFIYVRLPDSFKRRYPTKYHNLARNKNRLTSPFDLHVTLKDILRTGTGTTNENTTEITGGNGTSKDGGTVSCVECGSLFEEVAINRSCSQAGIPDRWCTCESDYDPVPHNDRTVNAAVNFIVEHLNDIVKETNSKNSTYLDPGTQCSPLRLKRITSVRQKVFPSSDDRKKSEYGEYILIFETAPNRAIYEATVQHNGPVFNIVDYVERINAYSEQSYCTSNIAVKRYCLCVVKRKTAPLKRATFV